MKTLVQHEVRQNLKSFLIWTFSIVAMCFGTILLFQSLQDSMKDLGGAFASMGAFSEAFGMNKLNIATLNGYFALEVGTMHGLGGAMFAAILGMLLLSKEEEGHTSEFLLGLPISRINVVLVKYMVMVLLLLVFNIICMGFSLLGIVMIDGDINHNQFLLFYVMQFIMQVEIASICFFLSACFKKKQIGLGIGISLIFYTIDMMARIVPSIEDLMYITPFSYANPSTIFTGEDLPMVGLIIGAITIVATTAGAFFVYQKRDLAA